MMNFGIDALEINGELFALFNYLMEKKGTNFEIRCADIRKQIDEKSSSLGNNIRAEYGAFLSKRRHCYKCEERERRED